MQHYGFMDGYNQRLLFKKYPQNMYVLQMIRVKGHIFMLSKIPQNIT